MNITPYEIPGGIQGRQLTLKGQNLVLLSEKDAGKVPQLNGSPTDYMQIVRQTGGLVVYRQVGKDITSVTVHSPKRLPREVSYLTFTKELGLSFPEELELEHALLRDRIAPAGFEPASRGFSE